MIVRALSPEEFDAAAGRLGEILADAVAGGAGVSFMPPFSAADGEAYWRGLGAAVHKGSKTVIAARGEREIAGTVILERAWAPNQPHRCEVAKLLVHRDYRRQGIGTLLIRAAEAQSPRNGPDTDHFRCGRARRGRSVLSQPRLYLRRIYSGLRAFAIGLSSMTRRFSTSSSDQAARAATPASQPRMARLRVRPQ